MAASSCRCTQTHRFNQTSDAIHLKSWNQSQPTAAVSGVCVCVCTTAMRCCSLQRVNQHLIASATGNQICSHLGSLGSRARLRQLLLELRGARCELQEYLESSAGCVRRCSRHLFSFHPRLPVNGLGGITKRRFESNLVITGAAPPDSPPPPRLLLLLRRPGSPPEHTHTHTPKSSAASGALLPGLVRENRSCARPHRRMADPPLPPGGPMGPPRRCALPPVRDGEACWDVCSTITGNQADSNFNRDTEVVDPQLGGGGGTVLGSRKLQFRWREEGRKEGRKERRLISIITVSNVQTTCAGNQPF